MMNILLKEVLIIVDKIGFCILNDILTEEEVKKFVLKIINSEKFKNRKYWNWKKIRQKFEETVSGKKD